MPVDSKACSDNKARVMWSIRQSWYSQSGGGVMEEHVLDREADAV